MIAAADNEQTSSPSPPSACHMVLGFVSKLQAVYASGPSSSEVLHGGAAGALVATAALHHNEEQRPLLEQFGQACSALHRSWEVRTWDIAAVETLLQLRYPQSLELFYQYPTIFMQGEIIIWQGLLPDETVSKQLRLRVLCMQKPWHAEALSLQTPRA